MTRLMWGMLRCRREQAWQTNTPRVSDAQSGSAEGGEERGGRVRRWATEAEGEDFGAEPEKKKEMKLGKEAEQANGQQWWAMKRE